jgi:FkbM family methyltransferase
MATAPAALPKQAALFRDGALGLRRALLAAVREEAPSLELPGKVPAAALVADLDRLAARPEDALGFAAIVDELRTLAGLLLAHRGPDRARVLDRLRPHATPLPVAGGWATFDFRLFRDLRTLALGAWEPENTAFMQRHLAPGEIALDVGAHVGHFTILAAALVTAGGAPGRVIAFEPAPSNFERLQRNLGHNDFGAAVELLPCAAGAAPGTATFFDDGGTDGTEFSMVVARTAGAGSAFTATIDTIDQVCEARGIRAVRFMKIDVEGAEADVLRGAARVLAGSPRVTLLIELHPWATPPAEVLRPLGEAGFTLSDVRAPGVPLGAAEAAVHFAKGGDVAAVRG